MYIRALIERVNESNVISEEAEKMARSLKTEKFLRALNLIHTMIVKIVLGL